MSLQIWLPLNGSLENQGLSDVVVTNSGASIDNNGKIGKCYSFDGNDDAILVPFNSVVSQDYSICCWFYKSELSSKSYDTIFGGPSGFEIETRNAAETNPVIVGWNWGKPSFSYDLNKWNHLVMTRNSSETKWYLNGELKATGSSGTIPSGNYYIGSWNSSTQQNYKGKINDFRIYNHCLSQKEIKEIAKGLVLHYKLDGQTNGGNTNLITGNFQCTSKRGKNYSRNGDITCLLTTDDILANKGKTLTLSYDVYSIGSYTSNDTTNWKANRFGIHGYIYYTESGGTSKVYYPLADLLTVGKNGHYQSSWTIPTNIVSVEQSLKFSVQVNSNEGYAYPADTNNDTWYIQNIKLEWGSTSTPCTSDSNIEYDCSGLGNHGTKVGTINSDNTSARYNSSYYFNGNNRIIIPCPYPLNSLLNEFTHSAWIKWNNNTEQGIHSLAYGNSFFRFSLGKTNAMWSYGVISKSDGTSTPVGIGQYGSRNNLIDGKWYFITIVFKDGICKSYLDGELIGTYSNTAYPFLKAGVSDGAIGAYLSGGNEPSIGNISDVRFYATALSEADIKELYSNAITVDDTEKVFAYEFKEE